MPHSELMSIGVFARASGLTASALRFYADSGVLVPTDVDPTSGYRYYDADQLQQAIVLRRLRDMGMSLVAIDDVLAADPAESSQLIDQHVDKVSADALDARRTAAEVKAALTGGDGTFVAALAGPIFAAAVEQILTATAHEPGLRVLGGLRIETEVAAVTLTATDRYRLSTRTLVPAEQATERWSGTVDGEDLRAAVSEIRRSTTVRIETTDHGVWLRSSNREDRYCRLLSEEFPDYRQMLDALPAARTRATASKGLLVRALEECGDRVPVLLNAEGVHILSVGTGADEALVPAVVTGPDLRIRFELTTLYPAVVTAIGPDLMIETRGADLPVTIRSADRGDLTTLAMPIAEGNE